MVIATVLIGVISYGNVHRSLIRLSYEINKLEIIEKFCINKEETTFQCEGKCHLKSQLEEADNKAPVKGKRLIEENRLILFSSSILNNKLFVSKESSKLLFRYVNHYLYLSLTSIFHPPKV